MMDNLARIISHGFAVVVVIMLGIGFIYRGELFPDLELPDFLVPSSEKMADAGDNVEKTRHGTDVIPGTTADEPVETASSVPAEPSPETPAAAPEVRVESPEAAAAGVTGEEAIVSPAVQETAETEMDTGTVVETLQAPSGEIPSPLAEEPGTTGSTGPGETGSAVTADAMPPTVSREGTPTKPQVAIPDYTTGAQPAAVLEESSSEPGIFPETVPQTGFRTSVPASDEGPAVPAEKAVTESPPVTTAERQPDVSGAAQSTRGPSGEVKPYELLAAAREAFWLHNYDDAEKNYRALTELEPQNPDGFGELGNMYFSQGRWEEAAAAYYEAGTRLVSEGRLDPARELVNVIRGLNGQQADELNKLITSAASTSSQ
ncbi:MAG: tetratricopeptide repeat protein [Gammaproteobacteria bacterium]